MVLVCHVVLQDNVTNGSSNFMGGRVSYHPGKIGGQRHSGSGNIMA